MLADTLHNKSQKKKGKKKKKNSKQLIQFCLQTLASSLHTVTTERQLPQAPKYEFLPHPTRSPTQKTQNQLTMASKEAQITRWVALRIARERIKHKIRTTKDEEEQEFRACAFHCMGASLAAWRAFLPPPTGRSR
jgi:HSP90 family molecular chaperone